MRRPKRRRWRNSRTGRCLNEAGKWLKFWLFRQPAAGVDRERDAAGDDTPAAKLRSTLEGVGKTLADLLLVLLAELEDSSLRLSLIIERAAGEAEKRTLRAEQLEIRTTIAELKKTIDNEAKAFSQV